MTDAQIFVQHQPTYVSVGARQIRNRKRGAPNRNSDACNHMASMWLSRINILYICTYVRNFHQMGKKAKVYVYTNVLAKCMWNTNTQKDLKYRTQNNRKIAEAPSENKTDTGAHTVHTG